MKDPCLKFLMDIMMDCWADEVPNNEEGGSAAAGPPAGGAAAGALTHPLPAGGDDAAVAPPPNPAGGDDGAAGSVGRDDGVVAGPPYPPPNLPAGEDDAGAVAGGDGRAPESGDAAPTPRDDGAGALGGGDDRLPERGDATPQARVAEHSTASPLSNTADTLRYESHGDLDLEESTLSSQEADLALHAHVAQAVYPDLEAEVLFVG